MEHQIFLPTRLNFNLCEPKSAKPTIVYAVTYFQGRQYKVNIGVKVFPQHWNKKKQCAVVSNCLSKLDNANNRIVNEKIKEILFRFELFLKYVCNNLNEEGNFYETFKTYINREMQTRKKTKRVSFETEFKGLVYEMSSERQNKYMRLVEEITKYMRCNSIEMTWDSITKEMLYQFFCDMAKKKQLQIRTFNDKVDNLYFLLNHADEHDYLTKYDKKKWSKLLGRVKESRNDDEKQSVYIALSSDKVNRLASHDFGTALKNEVRDIFVFLCLTGLSEGDLLQAWNEEYIKWIDNDNIRLHRNKNDIPAIIPLANEKAKALYSKFKDGFSETKLKGKVDARGKLKLVANECGLLNGILHQIIKETDFDEEVPVIRSFVNCKEGKIIADKRKEYKLLSDEITMYDSRHTFITISYYSGMDKELIKTIVGHTSDAMIDRIYLKLDKDKETMKRVEEINAHYQGFNQQQDEWKPKANTVSSQPSYQPISNVSLKDYEEKIIESHELKRQVHDMRIKCENLENKSRLLQDYAEVFDLDDYLDEISRKSEQADQEDIFVLHDAP